MPYKILAINPGSTSTKLAIYLDDCPQQSQSLVHSAAELSGFNTVIEQFDYRLEKIYAFLATADMQLNDFAAIVARGGLLRPVAGGTYRVNAAMLDDLRQCRFGAHASNLGALLADRLATRAGCPAYIVDPVVVDELAPIARITGRPEIKKRSIFHALNQKAVARRFAAKSGHAYTDLNIIVAHLGGGISIGCHAHGKVIEVNNCLDGQGPFSPERAGTVPAGQLASDIFTAELSPADVTCNLAGHGGLVAHLGTNNAIEVEQRIAAGDTNAKLVYDAMIYQIARYIAAAAVPVCGHLDAIIITGGLAHSKYITTGLTNYIGFLAPVELMPGEDELQALAAGAWRVLAGHEPVRDY